MGNERSRLILAHLARYAAGLSSEFNAARARQDIPAMRAANDRLISTYALSARVKMEEMTNG